MKPKKTIKQMATQMERIYKLYFEGFGTPKMMEKCENIFNPVFNY